ncbi:MAG: hypothetical protein V9H69_10530 [Anaerolineae bacterium]
MLACTGTGFRVKLNGKGQEGVVPFEDARLAFPHLPAAAKARLKAGAWDGAVAPCGA